MMAFMAVASFAQKDVTTFLGIPVDGLKKDMRQKLIEKGYKPKNDASEEYLTGEFNGQQVYIFIGTNNNKVSRIAVDDVNPTDEANIKIRFNKLVSQFEKNQRYITLKDYSISDDEDISYEMMVHKKNYDAIYYQNLDLSKIDTLVVQQQLREELLKSFTNEQIESESPEVQAALLQASKKIMFSYITKKAVWFRICESFGKYYIMMFYDNEYNRADGEDL